MKRNLSRRENIPDENVDNPSPETIFHIASYAALGWKCPQCNQVWAPWLDKCSNCTSRYWSITYEPFNDSTSKGIY